MFKEALIGIVLCFILAAGYLGLIVLAVTPYKHCMDSVKVKNKSLCKILAPQK